jgi:predicted AlkP superfamily pyrophosphatase or phosphodiesterase
MRHWKPASFLVATVVVGAAATLLQMAQAYPMAERPAPRGQLRPLQPVRRRSTPDRTVVMLVFDGLPAALVDRHGAEHFDRLAHDGTSTTAMEPVFPTLSMPNHMALSTGCGPARTGIVSNRFIDPDAGLFGSDRRDARWLLECEPLPVVAERQGVRTAVLGWVTATRGRDALAEVVIESSEPPISIEERAQQVVDALHQSAPERPSLLIAYFSEPDATLHAAGLDSAEADAVMRRVDSAVGRVMDTLAEPELRARAALLVVSDHGMMPVSRHLNIGALLRRAGIQGKVAADGPIAHVYLDDASTRGLALAALRGRNEFESFASDALPDWAPLGTSKRLGDIVLFTKPPYYMSDRGLWPRSWRWYGIYGPDVLPQSVLKAAHGYPPSIPEMRSVFYAWGAGIAAGQHLTEMHSVDVHPTIAMLLGIQPGHPLDGHANRQLAGGI